MKQDSQIVRYLCQIRDKMVVEEGSKQAALDKLYQWVVSRLRQVMNFSKTKEGSRAGQKWSGIDPLCLNMLWLCLKERLLTRDKLRDHIEDTSYILCGYPEETNDHLFFQCGITRQVWTDTKTWMGFTRDLNTIKAAVKWTIKEARGTGVKAIGKRMGIACIVY